MASSGNTPTISSSFEQLVVLVNQAREGNRSAFSQLADQFYKEIFRMVFYRVRSRIDAEDITQDVFLKAYQKISSLKEAAKFRGWLFSITLNRIRDFQRKKRFRSGQSGMCLLCPDLFMLLKNRGSSTVTGFLMYH